MLTVSDVQALHQLQRLSLGAVCDSTSQTLVMPPLLNLRRLQLDTFKYIQRWLFPGLDISGVAAWPCCWLLHAPHDWP